MAKKFSIEAIFSGVDRLSAPMKKIGAGLARVGKAGATGLRGLEKVADRTLGTLGRFQNEIGLAGVASLAGLGFELKNVVEHGAELEKTLVRTGSAFEKPVRIGTEGFARLTAAARGVGQTTEFSAQQGAEALNSLATAGYDLEQSVAALPTVLDFASAAVLDLGAASDITSDTLGAFSLRTADAGKNALQMARVTDVLTRAAADSTTNVTELFEGIRAGGAFAATAGASLEQFVALQGVLANKGVKGAEAGTAIRNSYLHLTKQTKEAADMTARLGVKIAKNKDGSIDLMTTIGRFTKATQKLTRAKKAEAIATIFGAYTVGPFLSLMDSGEDTIRRFTENLEGATGVTREMAESMRESTAARIAKFFNILEDVRLTVFEAIAPTVTSIAESVGKWVTANRELIGTKAGEWAESLKEHLPEIWLWTERTGKAVAGLAVAAVAVKTLSLAVEGYEAAAKVAAGAAWLYNAAVKSTTLATIGSTIATGALKVAQLASRTATLVMTAAQFAYSTQLNATTFAAIRLKVAEVATRIATYASRAATLVASAAQTAYGLVLALTTGGLGAFKVAALASVPAIGAQAAALLPLVATLGAATAAVAALVAAWNQYNALDKELEGSGGITGTVGKMIEMGTFDPFEAHDAAMNEKAIAEREKRDMADRNAAREADRRAPIQVVSPHERAAAAAAAAGSDGKATVDGTITVEAKKGTAATVKARPSKVPIKVAQPSGAF